MVKKIFVFFTILSVVFVGIPQFNSKASTVIPVDSGSITIGSLLYNQGGSSDIFNVGFSLPIHNSSTYSMNEILTNVDEAFGGNLALFMIKHEVNNKFEYRLLNSSHSVIEVMPNFDTIMFLTDTNEMAILLNGNIIEYYNNSMGIEYLNLVYTGIYDGNDFDSGYLLGYENGLNDGVITGFADGYAEARQELWTSRYQIGYNQARDDYGYFNIQTNEWVNANIRYADGLRDGESIGYDLGYDDGLIDGEIIGYNKGLIETDATGFGALLSVLFTGLGGLLAIEILPGIHIGAIVAVPLVFGIIFFILGKRKGD